MDDVVPRRSRNMSRGKSHLKSTSTSVLSRPSHPHPTHNSLSSQFFYHVNRFTVVFGDGHSRESHWQDPSQITCQDVVYRLCKWHDRYDTALIDHQALTPTPILGTLSIPEFTSHSCSSLIVAKPDRVEVWDVDKTGLVWRTELEVWGSVLGIERVVSKVGGGLGGVDHL